MYAEGGKKRFHHTVQVVARDAGNSIVLTCKLEDWNHF